MTNFLVKMTDQEKTVYLFLEDSNQIGDLALIFGIRDWRDPLEKACQLYRDGLVKYLVLSGGINRNSGEPEAVNMHKVALAMGVPDINLIVENEATNTLQNVLLSKKIIDERIGLKNVRTICGVMANVHARRALMTLTRHLPLHIKIKACPYTYKRFGISKDNWHCSPEGRKIVESELDKIKTYLAKGDIAEITPR